MHFVVLLTTAVLAAAALLVCCGRRGHRERRVRRVRPQPFAHRAQRVQRPRRPRLRMGSRPFVGSGTEPLFYHLHLSPQYQHELRLRADSPSLRKWREVLEIDREICLKWAAYNPVPKRLVSERERLMEELDDLRWSELHQAQ